MRSRPAAVRTTLLATGGVAAIVAIVVLRPDHIARVGAGVVAHNLCSSVFVGGHDAETSYRELVQPVIGDLPARLFGRRVDPATRTVTASIAGLQLARAEFTPGYGCRLVYAENDPAPAPRPRMAYGPMPPPADLFAPPEAVTATAPTLVAAIDRVFAEVDGRPRKDVKAVVVVRDGRVIAERYAPDFGVTTPLLSYSVAKSFTNALVGVLAREGRLRVEQSVNAPEWRTAGDPRAAITIEDLMRMQSGLDAEEAESASDPVAAMEYRSADMAGFAARRPAKAPRATVWEYTSANTLIVDRLVGQLVGGGAPGLVDFAERELFGPLGMRDVTMEFDGRGTFVGSTYVWAPARAYARFGQLYLDDGVAPDGRRLLPEGWVAWSRRTTMGEGYGAGFFTNEGSDEFTHYRLSAGFPKDGFFASGFLGERIYIVPSARLVIARFGYSRPPRFGLADDLALIDAAVKTGAAPRR